MRVKMLLLAIPVLVAAGCGSPRISIVSQDATTGVVRFEIAGPVTRAAVQCTFHDIAGTGIAIVFVRLDNLAADARHAGTCAPPAGFTADPSVLTLDLVRQANLSRVLQSLPPGASVDYTPPSPWP